jgi:Phage virion morphogenesis family
MANVTINTQGFNDALTTLQERLIDLRPVFSDIGEYLLISTRQRFDDEVSPEGVGWAPLSPRYERQKAKQQSNLSGILKLTGELRDLSTS